MNTNKKYYKILNKEENHRGLQYHDGLNIDRLPFNPSGDCEDGGIYFSDVKNILAFINYGCWIREVILPENEEIYKNPSFPIKYKAHQVILGERREINLDVIKELVNEGADIHIENDYCLRYAAYNGRLDIVKYCVEKHNCDIHICDDYCLRYAVENGHLDIVKYCVEECGCDIHILDDFCLRWAAYNGRLDIIKYCVEKHNCDIHICDDYCLKYAAYYGHLNIVKYIINKGFNIKNKTDKDYVLNIIKKWNNGFYNKIIEYIDELEK